MGESKGPLTDAKFNEVFLRVRDLPKMRAFYHETLGLPIAFENPRFVEFRTGGVPIALHSGRKSSTKDKPHWFLEFLVRDLDAVVKRLRARGVACDPIRTESFGRVTSFTDPEGNEVGLEARS